MILPLPAPVTEAISRLNRRGHEAYAVGGCVRDLLRGVAPHDYDICVSCPPQETHTCFAGERVIDTGIKHGTVTVLLGGMPLEITTFRTDGAYADGRHPDAVRFTRSLAEDLKRRDFTVNAMAYHPDSGVTDLFGGQDDLRAGVIRCVGDARTRLTEDALRILRALRFAAQLDYRIAPATAEALHALCGRLSLVSRERVAEELLRMLRFRAAAPALRAFPDVFRAAMPDFPPEALDGGLDAVQRLPGGDSLLALAALLHACGAATDACLRSLRLSKTMETQATALCALADQPFDAIDAPVFLARLGGAQWERLLLLQQACCRLTAAQAAERADSANAALADGLPLSLRDLPVGGGDLQALGYGGPAVGQTLKRLHEAVLRRALPCDREALLDWAKQQLPPG